MDQRGCQRKRLLAIRRRAGRPSRPQSTRLRHVLKKARNAKAYLSRKATSIWHHCLLQGTLHCCCQHFAIGQQMLCNWIAFGYLWAQPQQAKYAVPFHGYLPLRSSKEFWISSIPCSWKQFSPLPRICCAREEKINMSPTRCASYQCKQFRKLVTDNCRPCAYWPSEGFSLSTMINRLLKHQGGLKTLGPCHQASSTAGTMHTALVTWQWTCQPIPQFYKKCSTLFPHLWWWRIFQTHHQMRYAHGKFNLQRWLPCKLCCHRLEGDRIGIWILQTMAQTVCCQEVNIKNAYFLQTSSGLVKFHLHWSSDVKKRAIQLAQLRSIFLLKLQLFCHFGWTHTESSWYWHSQFHLDQCSWTQETTNHLTQGHSHGTAKSPSRRLQDTIWICRWWGLYSPQVFIDIKYFPLFLFVFKNSWRLTTARVTKTFWWLQCAPVKQLCAAIMGIKHIKSALSKRYFFSDDHFFPKKIIQVASFIKERRLD